MTTEGKQEQMNFIGMPHIEVLDYIQKVKEVLETYKDGNLDEEEQKNYDEMLRLHEALEAEWQRRKDTDAREWEPLKPKDMTPGELSEAMEDIDHERKIFCRRRRGTVWSKEDEEEYDRMNEWAAKVFGEIQRRAGNE